jgi:hypothetical protein
MAERAGCLSLLLGRGATKSLTSGLPRLETSSVHPADRAAAQRAWRAAEAAHASFARVDVPDIAVADLAARLSDLLGVVQKIVQDLSAARRFLERNDPDKLARERADLELRRLGASAAEILALRAATDALATRASLADRVRVEIGTLEARLVSAGQELEAFRARVEARNSAEALGHELGAYLRSAQMALEAFERTRKELG